MKNPDRSTASPPKPAVVGPPITVPFGSRAPAAPVGQREAAPLERTKRPPWITRAVRSGSASSSLLSPSATRFPPVGPTDPDSRLWRCPLVSLEQLSLLNRPGVPLANAHDGMR